MKISIPGPVLLTCILIIFQLADIISWSWWWVFSPIWITALGLIGFFVILFIKAYREVNKDAKKSR